jgi:hypothetical protein
LLWQLRDGFSGREGLQFWQIYFLTTPHRWVTLLLVFFDRQQFAQHKAAYLAIAIAAISVCLGVRLTTGTLLCLLAVDYIWNAWHFAAQHHGIYRIYARVAGKMPRISDRELLGNAVQHSPAAAGIEKWSFRFFLLYVILRVAGATWPYLAVEQAFFTADWLFVGIPVWLFVRDLLLPQATGRTLYLMSVLALYLALLAAVHFNRPALMLSLTTASAVFHATEYLALVAWNVNRRQRTMAGKLGIMQYFAPRWSLVLGTFVLVLGATGWLLNEHFMRPWLTLNVMVAFLHYAYDGLIWRSSSPARQSA